MPSVNSNQLDQNGVSYSLTSTMIWLKTFETGCSGALESQYEMQICMYSEDPSKFLLSYYALIVTYIDTWPTYDES